MYNKEDYKMYYQRNKEKVLLRHREWVKKNKDKISLQHKEYCSKHKNEIKKQRNEYYKKNIDKINERKKKYIENNPDKIKEYRNRESSLNKARIKTWKRVGIVLTWNEYVNMFNKQSGQCSICKTYMNLRGSYKKGHLTAHVDHCHTTGNIRGLICHSCNLGLGYFKDNSLLLKNAAEYIDKIRY